MITGSLDQIELRRFLSRVPAFARAFDWMDRCPAAHPDAIVQLQGTDLFVNVHGYDTKRREDCRWEAHRRTADIQLCLEGGELIDWTPVTPAAEGSYEAGRDFEVWAADIPPADTIALTPGKFAIFLPGELHRPVISNGIDAATRKLVVKIAAHLLS